jgi:hypothetical protein
VRVLKFEELPTCLEKLFPGIELPSINRTEGVFDLTARWTESLAQRVYERFLWDFEVLKYDKESWRDRKPIPSQK